MRKSARCAHPLASLGYDFDVPLLEGDHVTDDTGTGFVHTAPGHGADDYNIWIANQKALRKRGIDTTIPFTVDADGVMTKDAPGFEGKRVLNENGDKPKPSAANDAVIKALQRRRQHHRPRTLEASVSALLALQEAGHLPQHAAVVHRAGQASPSPLGEGLAHGEPGEGAGSNRHRRRVPPHPNPLPKGERGERTLRQIALEQIKKTEWVPEAGENRITGMIENRPDWVVSRQRAWGVPITVFVAKQDHGNHKDGDILHDADVNAAIFAAFEKEGADAWFAEGAAARFLKASKGKLDPSQVGTGEGRLRRLVRFRLHARLRPR